jgi:hypothetical protein
MLCPGVSSSRQMPAKIRHNLFRLFRITGLLVNDAFTIAHGFCSPGSNPLLLPFSTLPSINVATCYLTATFFHVTNERLRSGTSATSAPNSFIIPFFNNIEETMLILHWVPLSQIICEFHRWKLSCYHATTLNADKRRLSWIKLGSEGIQQLKDNGALRLCTVGQWTVTEHELPVFTFTPISISILSARLKKRSAPWAENSQPLGLTRPSLPHETVILPVTIQYSFFFPPSV